MTEEGLRSLVAVVWPDGADDEATRRGERALLRSMELAVADPECSLVAAEVLVVTPDDPDVDGVVADALESSGADAVLLVEASGYCAPTTVNRLVARLSRADVMAVDARHLPVESPEVVDFRSGEHADYDSSCALVLAPRLHGAGDRVVQAPGAVFARGMRLDLDAVAHHEISPTTAVLGSAPAVTVVIRTQGRRPATLTEVLCCLAVQSDQNFEIIIVVHDGDAVSVEALVESFEVGLAGRVRVLDCVGGERGRPANVGARAARGAYVVFLDDDDAVAADWIATITEGARSAPGKVVRWWAAAQPRAWGVPAEVAAHRATGPLTPTYTHPFNVVQHLWGNQTPFHTYAFPRDVLDEGFAFDESLVVVEDWQFLLRVALHRGVIDMERITCVYHRWESAASADVVTGPEWEAVKDAVRADLDRNPLVLPPGSVADLVALHRRALESEREVTRLRKQVDKLQDRLSERQKPKPAPDGGGSALPDPVRKGLGKVRKVIGRD